LLAQGRQIVPIPGTTKLSRVTENLGARKVVLTPADLALIDKADFQAEGARYSEANERLIDR
ncbi:MAG TPA: aldo/keto reductase, partial [Dermatophilaceae bacterium]|nr:aldo/keto reductase [Dermatophilaceae bacterium]